MGISQAEYDKLRGRVDAGAKGKKPKNKFNAKKTEYNGSTYDSKKEAEYAAKLDLLKKTSGSDKVSKIEKQVKYDIIVNDKKIGFYKLDFKVTYADGCVEHIDVKGLRRGCAYQIFRLKKKLVEALYGIEIKEV
jgi:hypothetical protein